MSKQFLRYALAGLTGTLVHYTVMLGLIIIGWDPTDTTAVGALLGALVNYALCSRLVFTAPNQHNHSTSTLPKTYIPFLKFVIVALALASINTIVFDTALPYMPGIIGAQLLSTLTVLPIGFLLNRHWSFARPCNRPMKLS